MVGDALRGIFQSVQPQQSGRVLRHEHSFTAHSLRQPGECTGVLLEPFVHTNAANYQPQSAALPGWRAGRFLRTWHHGGHTLRRATGHQTRFLNLRANRRAYAEKTTLVAAPRRGGHSGVDALSVPFGTLSLVAVCGPLFGA